MVAIDGPSGVGKSTVARLVSQRLGFAYIDTGALYRTVALIGKNAGVPWDRGHALAAALREHTLSFDERGDLLLDGFSVGLSIRTPEMSEGASAVSKHREVRDALLETQRALGKHGGVVLEGRDIGTVVFPDAEIKIFLTASDEVRAQRRYNELKARGDASTLAEVLDAQRRRDHADSNRSIAPLKRAEGSIEIDTGDLTAEGVAKTIIAQIKVHFPLTSK